MACYVNTMFGLSPLGYWRLAEPSGTSAADLGSGAHTGTYVNTPTLGVTGPVTGDAGKGITCTAGSTEYVNVASLTTVPATVSVVAWAKKGAATFNDEGLAGWWDTGGACCLLYLTSIGTTTRFLIGDTNGDTQFDSTGLYDDGLWHQIVGTYDGTDARLYFDKVLKAGPVTKTAAGGTAGFTFKIGQYGTPFGSDFDGSIAEPAYFDYALSGAQITALYDSAPVACATPRSFGVLIA